LTLKRRLIGLTIRSYASRWYFVALFPRYSRTDVLINTVFALAAIMGA